MSDSLQSHGLQHARLPCSSLFSGVRSDSCPLNQWCYLTISSAAMTFAFCLRSLPGSGSFSVRWLFASGGQRTKALASAAVLPMNIQGWFPLGSTGLLSLQSEGLSRVFSSTTVQNHQFSGAQPSIWSNSHIHTWLLKKNIALPIWTSISKMMSLLFNMLSGFIIAFLPRSKCLLISWLQSPSTVI